MKDKKSHLNKSVNNTMSKEVIDKVRDDCQILNNSHTALNKNKQFPKEHRVVINIENNIRSNNFEAEK